jgi:hypothetical protein
MSDNQQLVAFRAPPRIRQQIEAAAERELISASAWIRRACLRELERDQQPAEGEHVA